MIDPQSSKEIINEVKALTSEVYGDVASPALKEVGSVAGRTVKALLFPIRGMLWGWEKIEEMVEEGVKKRFEKIPEENRKSPEPEIAVPILQALSYTAQNETLRELYLNLLANSMDIGKEKDVHPSFVEMIKQFSALDAKVFERLSETRDYQPIINPVFKINNTNTTIANITPYWYIGWTIEGFTEFDISTSLVRLKKFGIIELMHNRTIATNKYHQLAQSEFLTTLLEKSNRERPDLNMTLSALNGLLIVNEYGLQFKTACQN